LPSALFPGAKCPFLALKIVIKMFSISAKNMICPENFLRYIRKTFFIFTKECGTFSTVKQLAGYPKKQVPLSIVSEGRTISGNELAEKINAAFVSVTQHLDPLYSTPVDIQHEIDYPEIPPELIISEIDVYRKLLIHNFNFKVVGS
jgi:hypothetical protein